MLTTKYETKINKLGPSVSEFLGEKMFILFGENAPIELAEYCLLIDVNPVEGDIVVGDILKMGNKEYSITAVGDAVKKNLVSLGHITLKFDGSQSPELPGTLYLEEANITADIEPGSEIQIISR
ncbi:PTS glucitol/sorbitol transporter subunit IIA [Robertmurraya sp. P23]|uniref:PTS glucitol/sorbitol transporter subunit IIA n=1 Tax=Robertmurraya sp. P23 TaxID=3436931 RepID=UPI003D96E851